MSVKKPVYESSPAKREASSKIRIETELALAQSKDYWV